MEPDRPKKKTFFTQWTNFVNDELKETSSPNRHQEVRARLKRLPYLQDLESIDDVRDTLSLMNQGRSVLRAALKEPLGYQRERGVPLTRAQRSRTAQWRHVMGFGGLETVCKAVILPRKNTWYDPNFVEFVRVMVETFELNQRRSPGELPSPNSRPDNSVREEFFKSANLSEQGKVKRVLNLNNHDLRLFREWVKDGRPLDSWEDRMQLAKALRNCSVHGALSATRAQQLGFVPVFDVLIKDMMTFMQAIFEHLVCEELP